MTSARVQEAGRLGPLVLRLVRKDFHQQAWWAMFHILEART